MSESGKAIFLSYAREDTDAARRIADALRGFGIEVWFDQNELRGGDAWDQKIRNQIRSCALFMPLISARTEERTEGYFRREWKLALDRTHDMTGGRTFIFPVVIDPTREAGAAVPDEFMRVQWTRLVDGLPTPDFVGNVKRLLDTPRKSPTPMATPAAPVTPAPPTPSAASQTAAPQSRHAWPIAVAVGVAALGMGGWWVLRRPAPAATPATAVSAPAPAAAPTAPATPVSDKSIAVLPFENRSEDKDKNAFFADGIHEDILTNLAHIAALRVVSRTSVMEYRSTTKKIRQIGQELGVAYVLEGSVQRAGNKVRVTGQLINARTDEHVWAQSYDRDLTDVFAIQADLAREIASALSAALSPQEQSALTRRPTSNPEAYDLVLKARQMNRDGNDTADELRAEAALVESALTLDPNFADAWAWLANILAQIRFGTYDMSDALLARCTTAIEKARALAPDSLDIEFALGTYYYYALRDYSRALAIFERHRALLPNAPSVAFMCGLVLRRQGKFEEAIGLLRRAQQLDPRSAELARNLVISYRALRRFDDAIAEQQHRVELLPDSFREAFLLSLLHFHARGSTREMEELLAGPLARRTDPTVVAGYRKWWAAQTGDFATALQIDTEHPDVWAEVGEPSQATLNSALLLAAAGQLDAARARLVPLAPALRARLAVEPTNAAAWNRVATLEALLGRKAEAIAAADKVFELNPPDALQAAIPHVTRAFVLAWTGDKDAAVASVRKFLTMSSSQSGNTNVHALARGPWLAPLQSDPRFQALLADPANNAPLRLP